MVAPVVVALVVVLGEVVLVVVLGEMVPVVVLGEVVLVVVEGTVLVVELEHPSYVAVAPNNCKISDTKVSIVEHPVGEVLATELVGEVPVTELVFCWGESSSNW